MKDNNIEGARKQKEDVKVPTVDIRTLSNKYKSKALNLMKAVWGQYIAKVSGHGDSSNAYIIYIRPGSESNQIKGWIDNNLIVIQTVEDIIRAFNNNLFNIRASTVQGNEFMTFKLEISSSRQTKKDI